MQMHNTRLSNTPSHPPSSGLGGSLCGYLALAEGGCSARVLGTLLVRSVRLQKMFLSCQHWAYGMERQRVYVYADAVSRCIVRVAVEWVMVRILMGFNDQDSHRLGNHLFWQLASQSHRLGKWIQVVPSRPYLPFCFEISARMWCRSHPSCRSLARYWWTVHWPTGSFASTPLYLIFDARISARHRTSLTRPALKFSRTIADGLGAEKAVAKIQWPWD